MTRHNFTIFISGSCEKARQAVGKLRFLCEQYLKSNHTIRIVDVELFPDTAEKNGIMVTPTLISGSEGLEEFRVVGDLRDAEEVFQVLGFDPLPVDFAMLADTQHHVIRRPSEMRTSNDQ